MTHASDKESLDRVASGDVAAFTVFFDHYAPQVLGLLLRLTGNAADAEDVLQETFCQVWRSAGNFDPARGSVNAWLATLARTRAIDWLRRRQRQPESAPADPQRATSARDPALERTELCEEVEVLLRMIPQEQRRAIELSYFHGCTHVEIAAREGIPLGTAKTRITLGMKRLRDLYDAGRPGTGV